MSLVFREQEGSYLAGMVAGLMTQEKTEYTNPDDKVVGFLGGQESDLIGKFQAGYEAGVEVGVPRLRGPRAVRGHRRPTRSTTRPRARRSACSR